MTCAKKSVVCRIDDIEASNWCATPQSVCPRLLGEDYTKCKEICNQSGHAEANALKFARTNGINLAGKTAVITGHHYVCSECGKQLKEAGIKQIRIIIND